MAQARGTKKDFSTRFSPETLQQLDALVRGGKFRNRTVAIEAAVDGLYRDLAEERARKRAALERAAGALAIGITSESFRRAERDRMEWEAQRAARRK